MKRFSSRLLAFFGFLLISLFFFYPILKGEIPFPGESLVSNYAPYSSYSYNGYAPGGVPNKAQGPDVIKEIYPWKLFVIDQLKKGQIPFWNPYNFSGNPLMANFQSNVFYPLNVLFFLFSFTTSWTLYIFLTPLLSGFFVYLYLQHKKVHPIAAFYGGIVFSFSSYMVVWMEYGNIGHTLLWLPLVLLLIDLFFESKRLRYPLLLVLTLSVSFLAGYIQGFFYLTAIAFLYACLQSYPKEKGRMLFLFPLFILSLILGAFQLFPTLTLFSTSSRSGYTLSQIQYLLNPVWYVITVLIPDFFGNPATRNYWFNGTYIERVGSIGLIPLWFAFAALFYKQRSKEVLFFAVLALLSLLLTTDLLFTKYLYLIPIPVISTTVPTRMLSVFVVCASLLSGFGLDLMIQRKEKKPFVIAGSILASILFFACVGLWGGKYIFHSITPEAFSRSVKNVVLGTGLLIGGCIAYLLFQMLKTKKYSGYIVVSVFLILTIFDLFRFFQRITPFSPTAFVYPVTPAVAFLQKHQGIDRSWGYDQGLIESNFQTAHKIYSPEGNDPLHNLQYTQFIMSSKDGKVPQVPARPDANIFNTNTDEDFLHNLYRQKVLNILGVKYILHKDTSLGKDTRTNNQRFDPQRYDLIWQDSPWQIYENKQVAKRIFFTSTYVIQSQPQKTLDTLFSPTFDEHTAIVLEKQPPSPSVLGKGEVRLLSYTPNSITLRVNADTDGLIFISDVYTPNWVANIDGNVSPVLRADYAFRAIPVLKGTHLVTVFYQDHSYVKGLWIALGGVVLLVGYFCFFRYYKKWNL